MVDIKYGKAYSEVLEILKYIPVEDYNKIPKEKIQLFKKYATVNSTFIYNPSKTLEENKVSRITKGIIAILFRDYWATNDQKEKIVAFQKSERNRIEMENREKFNYDNLFNKEKKINESTITNNVAIIEYKESFFSKIISRIKNHFIKK